MVTLKDKYCSTLCSEKSYLRKDSFMDNQAKSKYEQVDLNVSGMNVPKDVVMGVSNFLVRSALIAAMGEECDNEFKHAQTVHGNHTKTVYHN
jgi:hypothetical protein